MKFISEAVLQHLKEQYPKGTRVELIEMDDPYSKLREGAIGTVTGVDDIGTVHVSWDCGSSLGLVYGEDRFRKFNGVTVICYGKREYRKSREEALAFYMEGANSCEGSERERYAKICADLLDGKNICKDE